LGRESGSSAVEVEDLGAKRVLPAELEARETLVPHEHPSDPLGVCRVVPKRAREAEKPRIYGLHTSHARASPNPSRKSRRGIRSRADVARSAPIRIHFE